MPDRDAARLLEIATAVDYIESFVAGLDEAAFINDSRTSAAVAMYLIVIGESARTLSDAAQSEAPEIPWPQIVALRNRIAHGYQTIDRAAIWSIATTQLAPLISAVRRMLAARGETP